MSKENNLTDFLTDVAGAIRTKKGYPSTQKINPQDFSDEIASIQSGSAPVLQEKTVTPLGSPVTVTPDNGYNGLSKVIVNAISPTKAAETYIPTTNNQYVAANRWLTGTQTIKGDKNLIASNIKKGVTIFNVTGTYEGTGGSGDAPPGYISFTPFDWLFDNFQSDLASNNLPEVFIELYGALIGDDSVSSYDSNEGAGDMFDNAQTDVTIPAVFIDGEGHPYEGEVWSRASGDTIDVKAKVGFITKYDETSGQYILLPSLTWIRDVQYAIDIGNGVDNIVMGIEDSDLGDLYPCANLTRNHPLSGESWNVCAILVLPNKGIYFYKMN